jgi:hypothetical protein
LKLQEDELGSEGRQRKISTLFVCAFQTVYCFYIRKYFIIEHRRVGRKKRGTYSYNGGIIRHRRGLVFFDGALLDLQILHIGASKYDVLVELVGRGDLPFPLVPTLGAKGPDILEGDGRVVRVDLM